MSLDDREGIARGFSSGRDDYLRHACGQSVAADRLMTLLDGIASQRIADLGCGPGLLTERLVRAFPDAEIHGIDLSEGMIREARKRLGGAKNVSFAEGDIATFESSAPFDLVASNYALQWVTPLAGVFSRIRASLAPNGTWAFAAPLDGSFAEFYDAYKAAVGEEFSGVRLRTPENYSHLLEQMGFTVLANREETLELDCPSPRDVLHSFRSIGATFRFHAAYAPLSVGAMRRLLTAYAQRYGRPNGSVPLTHRFGCFVARKTE
jgi:malonyl-CoA O-methyltransferase